MRVSSAEERFQWAYDIVKMIMEYTPDFGKEGADMRDATRQALAQAGVPLVVRHQFLGNRWAPQTAPCADHTRRVSRYSPRPPPQLAKACALTHTRCVVDLDVSTPMRQPVLGESARWLAVATMATMATPKRKVGKKKSTGSVRWLTPPTHPT